MHADRFTIKAQEAVASEERMVPWLALVSSFVLKRTEFQDSISHYYWTLELERNLFVGVLCAIAVFLIGVFMEHPLEFSAFPAVILVATLLRLSLNVATTRLIAKICTSQNSSISDRIKGSSACTISVSSF